jgi:hypothetical protein
MSNERAAAMTNRHAAERTPLVEAGKALGRRDWPRAVATAGCASARTTRNARKHAALAAARRSQGSLESSESVARQSKRKRK